MTTEITNLIAQVIIALLGLGCLWLLTKARHILKVRAEAEEATELDKLIYQLVAAAEQQLKAEDPTGQVRKQYVIDLLTKLGFEVNAEINARIEAAVYAINLEQKHEARQDAK